ncbi:hypothetical protein BLNAU_5824 [Blattamonas nauphoetae]|uniref:Uncharacterized protein n=1 Tax=Blattamonas nauphoetae TaxID=2049346 RepID=A0ABQ9Y6B7_9EUKA|nr:hypothetical protein BLNAU_5824 [Blattamonas nauphoetae]
MSRRSFVLLRKPPDLAIPIQSVSWSIPDVQEHISSNASTIHAGDDFGPVKIPSRRMILACVAEMKTNDGSETQSTHPHSEARGILSLPQQSLQTSHPERMAKERSVMVQNSFHFESQHASSNNPNSIPHHH